MDYVAGTDAASLLREHHSEGLPPGEALDILTAVASALDYAHQHGLLHRDVKPANILLAEFDTKRRRIFLADFGIARRVDDTAGLTATNMAVGTVAYAAPEQLLGEAIDARADQYALACTAFQLLTGSHPYDYSSAAVVITKHVTAPPPRSPRNDPSWPHWIRCSPPRWPKSPTTATPPAGNSPQSCAAHSISNQPTSRKSRPALSPPTKPDPTRSHPARPHLVPDQPPVITFQSPRPRSSRRHPGPAGGFGAPRS